MKELERALIGADFSLKFSIVVHAHTALPLCVVQYTTCGWWRDRSSLETGLRERTEIKKKNSKTKQRHNLAIVSLKL